MKPEQIQTNWDKLIKLIENTFEGERKEEITVSRRLLHMIWSLI